MAEKLIKAAIIIVLMVGAYILTIVIHELGHIYAYYKLYVGDAVKADQERQRAEVLMKSVCSGEGKMEKKLIEMVRDVENRR